MGKPSYAQATAQHLIELTVEAEGHRTRVLENIVGLVQTGALDTIAAVLLDLNVTRFLLEDELALLRLFIQKAKQEDCRLN